ncbi:B3 domain-containing protein Os07g0679700 isoform X2 [Magnolia sinica]|uniref:B3 domain-containing protein Os07g0679700 isoform X2 n=1 Tax=Magnolia sinica TaxID=86752 RepID=UPI002658C237|nr:B3 domain-containing protein Os07g0679700 isoform X2 [Magnolia sinica]
MASRACMNAGCGATAAIEWKKGWGLRSGGFANLCDKCGSAYEQLVYCDMFHSKESGWRECNSCGKRLHCGCIASRSSLELLDSGGVECIGCVKNSDLSSIPSDIPKESMQQSAHKVDCLPAKNLTDEKTNELCTPTSGNVCEPRSTSTDTKTDDDAVDKGKLMQLGKNIEGNGRKDSMNETLESIKREQPVLHLGEVGSTSFSNVNQTAVVGSSQIAKRDDNKGSVADKEMYDSLAHACLAITLGTSNPGHMAEACYASGAPNLMLPLHGVTAEGRELSKALSPFQQAQRSRHLLPKPPKTSPTTGSETSKDVVSQMRVARPPGEGRGRNQLLPRYWPRITDQELQQISGDSNSTIVPLFEKVLSASDAGRIGRLVLPKACAEAYFPSISQPEGLPLKIQDAKGKDWVFQFRFWPNNNSRMYVLEGVTPCIQSMQLQAGDTVTFSRIDPEGKLVMGFRKASNSMAMQDTQASAIANGVLSKENFYSGVIENLPILSNYSGLLQSLKGSADPHLSAFSEHLNSSEADIGWLKAEKHGGRVSDGFLVPERKRTRNIGSKSKRLHMDAEDALELKLTWEEAQDLLRPPPSVKPSIVVIEDHEFEEYEEPPVFGKRTIFTARPSGGQDQWAQCDNCYKWRRLPVDVLLPPKWTCADNSWDPRRSSCSVPDELSPKESENLLRLNKDFKRRRMAASCKPTPELEPSGLDALATAAVLGDDGNPAVPSIATTTKHPRHRPGCTCIVCIQPPSGKGPKHKPTCTCNVCMTVKRRFKTLMMRKKKRQSEREAETAQKKHGWSKDDLEVDSALRRLLPHDPTERDPMQSNDLEPGNQAKILTEGKGHIDLNCHPDREDDPQAGLPRMSMMSLLQVASLPLETYLKQNGLTSLVCEQQASSSSHALPQATAGESEGRPPDEGYIASAVRDRESTRDDGFCAVADQARNDHV